MNMLIDLKDSVEKLSEDDYAKFREWFWEYENEQLDKKIESGISTGKLQTLADKARKDFKEGSYSEL